MDLDIGLPVQELKEPLELALSQDAKAEETVLEATNCRGKKIHVHVTPTLRVGTGGEVEGLVLMMEAEAT
jgi:two-component system CheB/CheR fusion protein